MSDSLAQRRLGTSGPLVSAIGLGCMGMSGTYAPVEDSESVATIRAALDAGVTLLDTGDFYGMGHNEMLIRDALAARERGEALISVKFGALRGPDNRFAGNDTRPAAVANFLAYTLRRLGTDHVDIYRPARLDPDVPIEETVGAIGELVERGWVRQIGLSEVGAETLRRAQAVHPICDVQLEYSLLARSIEDRVLPAARELGIAVTAYGVLTRGLLNGEWRPGQTLAPTDIRAHSPRYGGENLERNLALVEAVRAVADGLGASVAQVAIAWVLSRGEDVVALVGASRRDRLASALGALELTLDEAALEALERALPPGAAAGERYPQAAMAQLDSER
ncbi:MAG TPA: aldo/keto reductase [Solirubrobacteraceae bacterium]|nr:aldo/keto reductase [Solirubrobacteraceae bacterium]